MLCLNRCSGRIALICAPPTSFCFGTTHPVGAMALNIRHLKLLGYEPVLVRFCFNLTVYTTDVLCQSVLQLCVKQCACALNDISVVLFTSITNEDTTFIGIPFSFLQVPMEQLISQTAKERIDLLKKFIFPEQDKFNCVRDCEVK